VECEKVVEKDIDNHASESAMLGFEEGFGFFKKRVGISEGINATMHEDALHHVFAETLAEGCGSAFFEVTQKIANAGGRRWAGEGEMSEKVHFDSQGRSRLIFTVASMMVWFDGEWKEEGEAAIGMNDGGFLRGEGVFETMLGLCGRVFALEEHWERFRKGAELFDLEVPGGKEAKEICNELLLRNGLTSPDDRVRVRVTRSEGHLLFTARAEKVSQEPIELVTSPFVRNERGALAGVKAISYGGNSLALQRAKAWGAAEALLANTRGEWCEGTWSNVFAVREGSLFTPPLTSGCLPGVTRSIVLELAREKGFPVVEEARPLAWLAEAEEIFLTSSLRGVMAVSTFEGRSLPVGEVTSQLTVALRKREIQGS
jgi:branched-chain amino acid aminotransferase